jgi:hypothetical protein
VVSWDGPARKAFAGGLQQAHVATPQVITPAVAMPEGWANQPPERFARRFPVSAQAFAAFQPFGVQPSYIVSNDQIDLTVTRSVIYQDSELPEKVVISTTPQGWWPQPSATEAYAKRFPVKAQQFDGWPAGGHQRLPEGRPSPPVRLCLPGNCTGRCRVPAGLGRTVPRAPVCACG